MRKIILVIMVVFVFQSSLWADIVFDMTCKASSEAGRMGVSLSLGGSAIGNNFIPTGMAWGAGESIGYAIWDTNEYRARMVGSRIEVFAEDIADDRFAGFTFESSFGKKEIEKLWVKASQTGKDQKAQVDVIIEAKDVPVDVAHQSTSKGVCTIVVEGFSDDGGEGEMEY